MIIRATRALKLSPLTSVLKKRSFVLFFAGQSISKVGNGMYQVGLGWAVYQITGSTVAMGAILAANTLSEVALTLFGGRLADRIPRNRIIILSDSVAGLILWFLAFASWHRAPSFGLLLGSSIALGVVAAFYRPAYQAINADLLTRNDLGAANSVLSLSNNVTRIAGPALGGLIYALSGLGMVFALDALSFSLAVLAMACTHIRPMTALDSDHGLLQELAAGWKHTLHTSWLTTIIVISLIANCVCLAPFFVLLPRLVKLSHGSVGTLGLLTSVELLAAGCAAMVLGMLPGAGHAVRWLLWLASAIGAGVIALGLVVGNTFLLFPGVILVGCGMSFDVIENTLIQTRVPKHLLSRVYSVNIVVSFSLLPLAYALSGFLAHWVGVRLVMVGGGALLVSACAVAALSGKLSDLTNSATTTQLSLENRP